MTIYNYLLIGLGGTGGSVLKNFKKSLYEEFRTTEIPADKEIRIRYLYADSSKTDIENSANWRTNNDIGGDISLDEKSRFPIMENNLAARLDDPHNNPVTHLYIGNKNYWTDVFSGLNINTGAGGQIRRLGVALFEPRCIPFVDQVRYLIHELEKDSGHDGVSLHVFSGAAGGTGSGIFLHILAQLRHTFRKSSLYPITNYLVLPEGNSPRAKNGNNTNYYANGYSALQELNAYQVSKGKDKTNIELGEPLFSPIDLTNNTDRFKNIPNQGRSTLRDRLQGCYILSNVNEKGRTLPIEDVPILIASFLYQRIFLIDQTSDEAHRPIKDAISFENIMMTDEVNEASNVGVRSTRFQTFGIKRLVIPEDEILEHFSSQFAQQAALQMLYNNWSGDSGALFLEEPVHSSYSSYVQEEEIRKSLKLSTYQLNLEEGILEGEINARKRWKKINEYWSSISHNLKNAMWNFPHENNNDIRLSQLESGFEKKYSEKFRGSGVERFYTSKRDDVGKPGRHVEAIFDTVESWLLTEWSEGNKSVSDLEVFIDDLIADLEKRRKEQEDIYDTANEKEDKMIETINANRKEWGQLGWFLKGTKRLKIFESQTEALRQYYEAKTRKQATSFSNVLLSSLIAELRDNLKSQLAEMRNGIDASIRFFESIAKQSCNMDEKNNAQDNVIKFYDPENIHKFTKTLLEEKHNQEQWSGVIRRDFLDIVTENRLQNRGRKKLFSSIVSYGITNGELNRILEEKSRNHADNAHTQAVGSTGRFIGVNIIQKLSEQFSDTKKLNRYVRDLMHSAQTFMKYNHYEYNGGSGPESAIAILLPEYPENSNFRKKVKQAFIDNQQDGTPPHIIDTNKKNNEITIISLKYKIPLRYLEPVHNLNEKFEYRLTTEVEKERALQELYIENHTPSLPSLLRPTSGYFGNRLLPYISLALAFKLFYKQEDKNTGELYQQIEFNNRGFHYSTLLISLLEYTSDDNILISIENINQEINNIDAEAYEILVAVVTDSLNKDDYKLIENRKNVASHLDQQIKNLKENRGNNLQDEIYLKFLDTIESSKKIINSV